MQRREVLSGALGATALLFMPHRSFSAEGKKKTCFLYDSLYLKHVTRQGHPERPERLTAIENSLKERDWFEKLRRIESRAADPEIVSLVHDRNYIEKAKKECEGGRTSLSTGDTDICRDSYDVALHAVGGVLKALDHILSGQAKNAFCAVRPPGHHATPGRGMGFCVFNNAAIAARYAQKKRGVGRVLIADWDVHHGNGTQETFYTDGSVFFMSTHQSPWYPNTGKIAETGEGRGKGCIMNRPFPAGAGRDEIIGAFKNDLLPAARDFRPDLIIVSAGFDSREGDPKGRFRLNDDDFRELTKIMIDIAGISSGGRLLSVLEGGYSLEGLPLAVSAHVDELRKA